MATYYGQPRIEWDAGGQAYENMDLPLANYRLSIKDKPLGKTVRSPDGYAETDYIGRIFEVEISCEYVNETVQETWTDVGGAKTFDYYKWVSFWRSVAMQGVEFTFYPHFPDNQGPAHFPRYLSNCVADIQDNEHDMSRPGMAANQFTLRLKFKSPAVTF